MAQGLGPPKRCNDFAEDLTDPVDLHSVHADLDDVDRIHASAHRKTNTERCLSGFPRDLVSGFFDRLPTLRAAEQELILPDIRAQLHVQIAMEIQDSVADVHNATRADVAEGALRVLAVDDAGPAEDSFARLLRIVDTHKQLSIELAPLHVSLQLAWELRITRIACARNTCTKRYLSW